MGDKTNIEWTDATWNPIRGCSRVSEGCRNCYAETVANRFNGPGLPYEGLIASGGQWNGQIKLVPEQLEQPLRWTRPRKIFVNSMSDLFHENVPFEYIAAVFAVMSVTTRHTYQVLTKRPQRMVEFFQWALQQQDDDGAWQPLRPDVFPSDAFFAGDRIFDHFPAWINWQTCGYDNCGPAWPYKNVWLGVSVEDQATADERIPLLLQTPAAVRWISAEPLLGAIDLWWALTRFWPEMVGGFLQRGHFSPGAETLLPIDWVVVGGESGTGARAMHPDWARSLRDQCAAAGVPFLFKQWGEWGFEPYPNRGMIPYEGVSAGSDVLFRCGKKKAGRLLDGVLHDGYPE